MTAYHLDIRDESVTEKIIAFLKSLPENSVQLSKEEYDEELESMIDEGFQSDVIGTHEEVFAKLGKKYAL
ncbi:hypothetical protein [Sulfuricurvum sp.]|uniref:hypothetical protein n=1 Tax=Sulfuricurvum sp. TaxID=2025608 RepID=UPI00286D7834|nr:hypothetical protein [Sulfuricurvum sp.]